MNLNHYVFLTTHKNHFHEERDRLVHSPFRANELYELKWMSRSDLLRLMYFCGIRWFDELPVAACEDDELRMAFISWRAAHAYARTNQKKKMLRKMENGLQIIEEHLNHFLTLEG